ncbi:MAG TPA: hypothetical protein VK466_01045 [Terriglobales bacterium]|nr:hypothetical protein [Terriglobales bacterium]
MSSEAQQRQQYLEAIDRLTKSRVLHGSESLCKLLRYLAEHNLQNPGVPVKEYQIATEVLGRSSDFDPHSDSAIRVQAGRLRVKLAEYYSTEGETDPVLVELPRGSYTLSFQTRPLKAQALEGPRGQTRTSSFRHTLLGWMGSVTALSVLLAAGVAALVVRWEEGSRKSALLTRPAVPVVFQTFWRGFVSSPSEPWVVFSNAAFVGRPETGMRYRTGAETPGTPVLDHYTGVGEVLAVHELDHVFHLLNREIRVKRGSLLSLDDAKNNNLIFVGSPAENLSLRDIPFSQAFIFQRLTTGPRNGDLAIANLHPMQGEATYFLGSPRNVPMSEDYAVVALKRGMSPTGWVLILAGASTMGTQAAAEYVTHENSLRQLLSRLNVGPNADLRPFEVVLHVKVARGVPVESEIVALRKDEAQ